MVQHGRDLLDRALEPARSTRAALDGLPGVRVLGREGVEINPRPVGWTARAAGCVVGGLGIRCG
jgi:hypothetical protein